MMKRDCGANARRWLSPLKDKLTSLRGYSVRSKVCDMRLSDYPRIYAYLASIESSIEDVQLSRAKQEIPSRNATDQAIARS